MEDYRNLKMQMNDMEAGCSAMAWETQDGKHLWGRNFDHSRIAEGSQIIYLPEGTSYTMWRPELESGEEDKTKYACLGTGFTGIWQAPVLYEGINEKGQIGRAHV